MSTASAHAERHSPLAHHFRDMAQQFDAAKLGIWIFLCTEILMFGGLFVAYIIFHGLYPAMFAEGARWCDWRMGAANTTVLIISSFFMASGVHYTQTNERVKAIRCMAITIVLGFVFLVIKYFEWRHKFELGLLPPHFFHYQGAHHKNLALFFALYFCMTGLHGIHVVAGMCLITWVMIRSIKGEFNSEYYTAVETVGLFWHLVDIVWIYLFPLLYLVG